MVHQKEIFKKIGAIIVEINEQYQYLSSNPEQLNDLELELFSANADFLSEHVKILRRINSGVPSSDKFSKPAIAQPDEEIKPKVIVEKTEAAPAIPVINEVKFQEPEEIEPQPEIIQQAIIAQNDAAERTIIHAEQLQPEPLAAEPKSVPSMIFEPKAEEIIPAVAVVEEPVTLNEVRNESAAMTDNIIKSDGASHQPKPTLNDIISAQKAQTIQTSSQFSAQPISDLKSAISLNDKLLYIKELFNGYSLAYSEVIEILNRFESFDIAETFLKTNYATKNNWTAKQSTVEKFYETLQRRYSK